MIPTHGAVGAVADAFVPRTIHQRIDAGSESASSVAKVCRNPCADAPRARDQVPAPLPEVVSSASTTMPTRCSTRGAMDG